MLDVPFIQLMINAKTKRILSHFLISLCELQDIIDHVVMIVFYNVPEQFL